MLIHMITFNTFRQTTTKIHNAKFIRLFYRNVNTVNTCMYVFIMKNYRKSDFSLKIF